MENLPIDVLARVQTLPFNGVKSKGKCVLYVMSRDQRVKDNHALLAAQQHAIDKKLPFAVVFVLHKVTKTRAKEHYQFMLKGLQETERQLKQLNIPFMMLLGNPYTVLSAAIIHLNPDTVYLDFNPLRGPQKLAENLAKITPVFVVDTHNVVPVWVTSSKQEYSARTIRPKIHKALMEFTIKPSNPQKHPNIWPGTIMSLKELQDKIALLISQIPTNGTKLIIQPGESAAIQALNQFIAKRLRGYAVNRNDPSKDGLSELSPYLHFGHLSSLRVLLEVQKATKLDNTLQPDADALIEEIIIRKELSDNYCYFNNQYDSLKGAPTWAQTTLNNHTSDPREFIYSYKQLESAQTHDEAWNAAQRQLTKTGKMHGYMRMYWAKKVLEWSKTPHEAHSTLVQLNDFYSIDGGDPNGYVGILWSIAGLHDRPWGQRNVYGTVRCMVYGGLKRKFDIAAYIDYNKA